MKIITTKRETQTTIKTLVFSNGERAHRVSVEEFRKFAEDDALFLSLKSFKKTVHNLFSYLGESLQEKKMNYYLCNGYVYLYQSSGSLMEDVLKIKKIKCF